MATSILSFPNRGPWGDSGYRGNCSGYVIKALLEQFKPIRFVDPAEGSGTSGDVARELRIDYLGFDLKDGFDLLRDSLLERVGEPVDLVFFHPPYDDIVAYSGYVWGNQRHPGDLSNCRNYGEYLGKLRIACMNINRATKPGGRIAILIGDIRRKGEYFSPQSEILRYPMGKLESVLIKAQHNARSDSTKYSGSFIPIRHEYLLIFRRPSN